MRRLIVGVLTTALATLLLATAFSLASCEGGQAARESGTIVSVEEDILIIEGLDGQTYEVDIESVVVEDLETGDIVEYDIVAGGPVNVAKKAN